MTVTLSLFAGAGAQFFDNNGNPLSGGKIYTYQAGTTTPLTTYTTNSGTVAHTNPIVLDAAGRVPSSGEIWLTLGIGYKFVVKTSAEVLIATYDNIPSSAQPPAANDADSIMYEQGYTVTAGSFVIGKMYRIATLGTTDFTLIGAINNVIGTHFIATGVGTGTGTAELSQTVETKLRETVSVKDFGAVGDGVTDDTAAIQAAINYASNNRFPTVYIPAGKYKISTIYLTYDASLNPGFNSSAIGRITLEGDGRMSNNDIANYAGGTVNTGSILESTATTVSAVVLATAAQESGGYPVRQQTLRNLSVVANTSAYVIQNYSAAQMSLLDSVAVVQLGTTGGGVLWRSSWASKFERVSISQPTGVVSSGSGLVVGSNIFAGLYSFDDCSFNGYTNTVVLGASQTSTNFAFKMCGFENGAGCGVLINGSQRNVAFDNCYFEFNDVSHLKISLSSGSSVRNLSVRDCFFYGASSSANAQTEPMINLNQVQCADIVNCHFFRPWTTLVYNAYDSSATAGQRTTVRNCAIDTSGVTYTGSPTIYLVDTNNVQGQPLLIENFFPEGSIGGATFTKLNASYQSPTEIDNLNLRTVNYTFAGVFRRDMDVAFEQDSPSIFSPSCRIYTCTAVDTSVLLPASGVNGYKFYIANSSASAYPLEILRAGGTRILWLAPGEGLIAIGDPNISEYVGFKTDFVV